MCYLLDLCLIGARWPTADIRVEIAVKGGVPDAEEDVDLLDT